jgi:hypothetical protein
MEPIVRSRRPALILATLSLIAGSSLAERAQSEEYHCRRGELVRRIEVRFADDADRLPCQVVYWKDNENPDRPQVPWKADHQLDFCVDKARKMVDGLRAEGWTCEADPALSEDAAELDAAAQEAAAAEALAPEATAPDAAGPEAAGGEPAAPPPAPAKQAPPPSPDKDAPPPAPGEHATDGAARPDQATLQAALDRDLRRLDELSGTSSGAFKPEMATLGDLNGDGLADGAALLTHRDPDGGPSHHLLVYLFDGKTFRPVARLNLEAYYQNFTTAAIADIAGGGIQLLLHMPRAGDPDCCPSGRRLATFELRDGQLVLVAESDSGA